MLNHYVMFRLKPECRHELPEVVKRLKALQSQVPAIRSSEVVVNDIAAPNSYDVLFHIRVDDEKAFKKDYMLHPAHVPAQKYIEARVCGIADIDSLA